MMELKCPVCGGREFIEGHIIEDGFRPIQHKVRGREGWKWSGKLESRLCKTCGLVLSFLPVGEAEPLPDI